MPERQSQVFQDALELPVELRLRLTENLIESLDLDRNALSPEELRHTVQQRLREVDEGSVSMTDWEQLKKRLLAQLERPS